MQADERKRPFHSGSQFADWQDRNCGRCWKFDIEAAFDESKCEIDAALGDAMFGDGTVSAEIALRMGFTDPVSYTWVCPEREEEEPEPPQPGTKAYQEAVEAAGQLTLDALAGEAKP